MYNLVKIYPFQSDIRMYVNRLNSEQSVIPYEYRQYVLIEKIILTNIFFNQYNIMVLASLSLNFITALTFAPLMKLSHLLKTWVKSFLESAYILLLTKYVLLLLRI